MNALKGYLVPAKKTSKKDGGPSSAANALPSAAPAAASANSTPGRSPLTSRPSSIYPNGDFRNGDRESIVDIKHDVMVNWLYQQQLEKLWGSCLPHEGVVLKRGRGDFICCPPSLKDHESMLFQQVSLLNVKVSLICNFTMKTADPSAKVCHDSTNSGYQNFPISTRFRFRATRRQSPVAVPSVSTLSSAVQEAPFCCFHQRARDAYCLG